MTTSDSTSGVTAAAGSEYAWLPDHQLHVVATVARVHELLATMTEVVYDYVAPPGPLTLDTVPAGDLAQVVVTAVAPLPEAASRYAATALTELRAALEHVLYAEVEEELAHELSDEQGRQVEMPAYSTPGKLGEWLRHGRRRQVRPLRDGPLVAARTGPAAVPGGGPGRSPVTPAGRLHQPRQAPYAGGGHNAAGFGAPRRLCPGPLRQRHGRSLMSVQPCGRTDVS